MNTREQLSLVEFKDYFFDQWIENTDPNFLSVFGIEINSNNALESYNKKLNAHIGSKKPNIWVFVEAMNEMLDDAVIDLKSLQKGERITRNQPRLSNENLMHRKHAEREILAKRFTPIEFINYLVENWGTKFFSQINTSKKNHQKRFLKRHKNLNFALNAPLQGLDQVGGICMLVPFIHQYALVVRQIVKMETLVLFVLRTLKQSYK